MVLIKKGNRIVGEIKAGRIIPRTENFRELLRTIPNPIKLFQTDSVVIFSKVSFSYKDLFHFITYLPSKLSLKSTTVSRISALSAFDGIWVTLKSGKRIFIRTGWKSAGSALVNKKFTSAIRAPYAEEALLRRLRKAQSKVLLFLSALPKKHIEKAELKKIVMTTPQELLKTLKAKKVPGNYIGTYNVRNQIIMLTERPTKELKNLTHLHIGYSLSFKVPKDPKFKDTFMKLFGEESKISRELFASGYATYASSQRARKAMYVLQPELHDFYNKLFKEW